MRTDAIGTAPAAVDAEPMAAPRLGLLGGFGLHCGGDTVALPLSAQRLVAFLALQSRPLQRLHVAGKLWVDMSEERANANLRTALWRAQRLGPTLIDASNGQLALARAVAVDVWEAAACARRVVRGPDSRDEADLEQLCHAGELLPDWYDDWILLEREHLRQLRLHALESLCETLLQHRRFGEAAEAGLAAVVGEPLRESAHRVLIRVYLAEGNHCEAVRQYRFYRDLVQRELGVEPSHQMDGLLTGLT